MSDDDTTIATSANNNSAIPSTEKKQSSRLLNALCLFVVLAIGTSVFLWHYSLTQTRQVLEQQKVIQATLTSVNHTIAEIQAEYNGVQTQQHTQTEQFDKQQQQISHLRLMLDQAGSVWHLSRIDHLIHLANDQVRFMHDAASAIGLLTAAKQELKQLDKSQWLTLVAALNQDIDALHATATVNVHDVLAQLNELDNQLSELPLTVTQFGQANMNKLQPITVPTTDASANSHWQQKLAGLWQQLRGILIIRHADKAIIPIIDTQQQAYLRQNLHLIVFQAKWAVLNRDNTLYHNSLTQFAQWVNRYFNTQGTVTNRVLTNVTTLQKVTLTTTLPPLTASLTEIQRLLAQVPPVVPSTESPPIVMPDSKQPMPASQPESTSSITQHTEVFDS